MKKMKNVIGICGPRLSGKDTVAALVSDEMKATSVSLADPIKTQYADMMKISTDVLYEQGAEKEKHRIGLITLGAIRRYDNIDWWCKALHEENKKDTIVIPDIRFKNEVAYFKENSENFILVEVSADDGSLIQRGWRPTFADTTTTETERLRFLDKVDYHLDNSFSINALRESVKTFIKTFNLQ